MNMRSVYRKVARKHQVSVQEVKTEMQKAIKEAWINPNKTIKQAKTQKEVKAKGSIPTIEEVIQYAQDKVF